MKAEPSDARVKPELVEEAAAYAALVDKYVASLNSAMHHAHLLGLTVKVDVLEEYIVSSNRDPIKKLGIRLFIPV